MYVDSEEGEDESVAEGVVVGFSAGGGEVEVMPDNDEVAAAAAAAREEALRRQRRKFEDVDDPDQEDYYKRLNIKLKWDQDVNFWFNSIEASMKKAGVNSQWTKREELMQLLPEHVMAEVKYLFCLSQDEAGEFPYRDIKHDVIRIFGPKPQDSMDKALSRIMVGRPSQLAKQLIDDICKCKPVLSNKCCQNVVFGLWRRSLNTPVRNAIAGKVFDQNTYKDVLAYADEVYNSNKFDNPSRASVAAVSAEAPSEEATIAAVSRGQGQSRGQSGGRGGRGRGGRGGGQSSQSGPPKPAGAVKGPKHPDNPPSGVCQTHHSFGKTAWWCQNPNSCPWKNYTAPRPNKN